MRDYIHRYTESEVRRLYNQAKILEHYIHDDILYETESDVLEVGCGVGAQSIILARNNPTINLTSIDKDETSIERAKAMAAKENLSNITFHVMDIDTMTFENESFDHIFVCFLLEHLSDPKKALERLIGILRNDGSIAIIEGYGMSERYRPMTEATTAVWKSYFRLHSSQGGDPCIGERLPQLLSNIGFKDIHADPMEVKADADNITLKKQLLGGIILPAFESIKDDVIREGFIDEDTWTEGMKDFYHIIEDKNGSFSYSWFKATAKK